MKPLVFPGVILAIAGAGLFMQLQANNDLKRQLSELQASVSAEKDAAAKARAEAEKLRQQNEAYQRESEELRKTLASAKKGGGNSPGGGSGTPGSPAAAGANGRDEGSFMKGVAKMFTDPEMKKAMRGQQAMGVRMMYGDLAKELGLSSDEANQVIEILTDRQMAIASKSMEVFDGDTSDPKKLEAAGKTVDSTKKEYDEQLKAILGEDRMKKLDGYERGIGDRMQLTQMQQSLAAVGQPLDEKQRQGILSIMQEERARTPQGPLDYGSKNPGQQMKAMYDDSAWEDMFKKSEDFNQRVLNRANTILSPDQVNAFSDAQKQQLEMMKMGMKMGREMFKSKGGAQPAAPAK